MDDIILSIVQLQQHSDKRSNFCRICWGPLDTCPGHVGYIEKFGPPPTDEEMVTYSADLEVRQEGLERKYQALNEVAKSLGYQSIEDLVEQTE